MGLSGRHRRQAVQTDGHTPFLSPEVSQPLSIIWESAAGLGRKKTWSRGRVEETTRLGWTKEVCTVQLMAIGRKGWSGNRNNSPRPRECLTDGCVDPSGTETQGSLCGRRSCLCRPWILRFCRWSTSCTCGSKEENDTQMGKVWPTCHVAC